MLGGGWWCGVVWGVEWWVLGGGCWVWVVWGVGCGVVGGGRSAEKNGSYT